MCEFFDFGKGEWPDVCDVVLVIQLDKRLEDVRSFVADDLMRPTGRFAELDLTSECAATHRCGGLHLSTLSRGRGRQVQL